jgi:DNA-directed RNA polymerase specialized sigma24 family protein
MKRAGEGPIFLPVGEEWKIVQRAIAGDCEPLAILFAHERPRLYRTAFVVLRNKEDAEDASQNGLLSAFVNLPSFQGRSTFSTWLMRVVLNGGADRPTQASRAPADIIGRVLRYQFATVVGANRRPEPGS